MEESQISMNRSGTGYKIKFIASRSCLTQIYHKVLRWFLIDKLDLRVWGRYILFEIICLTIVKLSRVHALRSLEDYPRCSRGYYKVHQNGSIVNINGHQFSIWLVQAILTSFCEFFGMYLSSTLYLLLNN